MKLGLVVNRGREEALEFATRLQESAARHGVGVSMNLAPPGELPSWEAEDIDVIVAVGGDGTVLEAVRVGIDTERPVLGFNLGTVGFLAEAEPEDVDTVVAALARGAFRVTSRMTLRARIEGDAGAVGVNDVVVEKIHSQRLVVLELEIDREPFLTYRADGVVFATPTGSTAYAFSAGGPLVDPEVDCVLVTPVAPHSLFDRTLVLPHRSVLRCRVGSDRAVRVSVDGVELGTVGRGSVIEIRRAEVDARFVRLDGSGFAARVTRKFDLG